MKLNIKAFSLAIGITWGLSMLVLAWLAAFGWGLRDISVLCSIYIGYSPTILGGIIGAIWGFVDGCIGGFLIAYFYNLLSRKVKK